MFLDLRVSIFLKAGLFSGVTLTFAADFLEDYELILDFFESLS
jgi:hypothetical protein